MFLGHCIHAQWCIPSANIGILWIASEKMDLSQTVPLSMVKRKKIGYAVEGSKSLYFRDDRAEGGTINQTKLIEQVRAHSSFSH